MTITDTAPPPARLANALETTDRVQSHLHPEGSFELADHPVPSHVDEVWRFTPLRRLRGLHADAPFGPSTIECTWNQPERVIITQRTEENGMREWRGITGYRPTDRASARIFAEIPSSLTVEVPADVEVAEPITIDLAGTDASNTEAAHIAVRLGANSRATIVMRHTGSAALAAVVEFEIGDGADATVVAVQDWADDTVHLTQHVCRVGRDARLRHVAVTFGGDVVRFSTSVEYAGPGGAAELLGLYFADSGQHLEHRLFVDHNQPRTNSNVDYRGALQGDKARTVWIGDVLIRKVAEGINTYESNKNLILTDGARADSVPNLEIETGNIAGAGHASTTGRLDAEQLFYLCSRGITVDEARRLVVYGFFSDLIRRIGLPELEKRLLAAVEAELALHVGTPQNLAQISATAPAAEGV